MDASLQSRAEQLASEIASQARTAEDLNGLYIVYIVAGGNAVAVHVWFV